ncbi:MAG: alpha-E domain-containing protein [Aestuariibacter sp.]
MLSRVAETLYWTARYVERAENVARLVNVNNLLLMDLPKGVSPGWEPLIDITGSREAYNQLYDDFSERNVLRFLTIDERNSSSVFNSLRSARDNTRTVREVVPRQVWEVINGIYNATKERPEDLLNPRLRFNRLSKIVDSALLFFGALDASMSHNHFYRFTRFGSILERADMTSRIIDVRYSVKTDDLESKSFENIKWISVLRSLSAYQMYRQQMGVRIKPQDVLKFLLLSPEFPRSVLFCVNHLKTLMVRVPNNELMLERIDHSISELLLQNIGSLKGQYLHDYIDELQIDLADIHNQLSKQYFLQS